MDATAERNGIMRAKSITVRATPVTRCPALIRKGEPTCPVCRTMLGVERPPEARGTVSCTSVGHAPMIGMPQHAAADWRDSTAVDPVTREWAATAFR